MVFFLDDKASIPVGYEGVSATRRQRPVLMAGLDQRGLNAMDHDNIPQHIVPSVSLRLIPPCDLSDSWYRGKPIIILKDAIFQASNAFRHAAELIKHLEEDEADRPMMFIGTDGGPDHNVTSIQVILSYIAVFLKLDLDFLCAVRTPPNFSVINPAERFMSTANIALMGVSLARNHLGKDEAKVRSLLSKKQWRDAESKHPNVNYRKLALDGTKDARELLKTRFESLNYKGESVEVKEPASEEEISELKRKISDTWSQINMNGKLTKADVLRVQSFKDFFENHVRCTTYTMQVKKCKDVNCSSHCGVRLDEETFDRIIWLPTPERIGDKYSSFFTVHGNEPNDMDVPSKTASRTIGISELPKANFPLAHTRARKIVFCTECQFPRLLYTQYALDKPDLLALDRYFEDKLYVCGSTLDEFPDVYQNPKITCHDAVTLHYYQAGPLLKGYVKLCAECLNTSSIIIDGKTLLCQDCFNKKSVGSKISKNPVERRPRGRPKKNA